MTVSTKAKWFGFAISIAGLAVALAWASCAMHPLARGDAKEFWAVVWNVTAPGEDPDEEMSGRAYTWYPPYVYDTRFGDGISTHGVRLKKVDEKALLQLFPEIIDNIIASPSDYLTLPQVAALIGEQPSSVSDGLAQLVENRDQIALAPDRMQEFLEVSYHGQWREWTAEFPSLRDHTVDYERGVGVYIQRAQCYWANILLEALHAGGILCVIWLPIISVRLRRFMPIMWGSVPLLILTPYFLGYCEIAFNFGPWSGGGALYPWVLHIGFRPLTQLTPDWDVALLNALPHPFRALTQWPLHVAVMSGADPVGPTPAAAIGLAIAAVLWIPRCLSRCVFRRTREAGTM